MSTPRRPVPDPLGRELRQPDQDLWAAILPNPSSPAVPYKVQYFAPFGLAGHQVHPTPEAALLAALEEGFTEPDPGALARLAHSAAWQAAYDTPAARPRRPSPSDYQVGGQSCSAALSCIPISYCLTADLRVRSWRSTPE